MGTRQKSNDSLSCRQEEKRRYASLTVAIAFAEEGFRERRIAKMGVERTNRHLHGRLDNVTTITAPSARLPQNVCKKREEKERETLNLHARVQKHKEKKGGGEGKEPPPTPPRARALQDAHFATVKRGTGSRPPGIKAVYLSFLLGKKIIAYTACRVVRTHIRPDQKRLPPSLRNRKLEFSEKCEVCGGRRGKTVSKSKYAL